MSVTLLSVLTLVLAQPSERRVEPLPDDGRIVLLAELTSLGSTGEAVAAIDRVLVAEFQKLLGDRLRSPQELAAMGPRSSLAVEECGGSPTCLLEIAAAVGWDSVIVGNLAGLGDQRVISLRHLNAKTGRELGRQSVPASGDERELIVKIRGAAVQLLAPERYVGAIEFQVKQPGVRVIVDGELFGTSPLGQNALDLPVGRHAVEATGEGLVSFSEMVEIRYSETRSIAINLPANTVFVGGDTPYHARWWTWAIAGAGVTGLGLGGYFGYLQQDTVADIEDRAASNRLSGDDAFLFEDQDEQRQRALVFYGIGGVLTLTAATLLSLDLF
ncbi:MAG: hypothetical protein AAFQ82_05705 [Myxococcota bacterium]